MDEIDIANEWAEQFTADAVRARRAQKDTAPSTGVCQSCQDVIEPERIRANPAARLCHDCAAEIEAARKRAQRLGG